jgi:hypothetical protein
MYVNIQIDYIKAWEDASGNISESGKKKYVAAESWIWSYQQILLGLAALVMTMNT